MACIVEKFKYYIDLNEQETSRLSSLEKEKKSFKKRTTIYSQGDDMNLVYVVNDGWCASFSQLADGGRQILNLHFPGDIVGTVTLPFQKSVCGLLAATDCVVCPFPKSGIKEIFRASPKIASLFYAMGMQDNVVLIDRMRAIGRMSGENRVILLLLQVWTRLKITKQCEGNTFFLPLSQELLSDALGLTTVYVNKMLKKLQEDKCIRINGRTVEIIDPNAMAERCDFEDRYYTLDTTWYPDN